MANLRCSQKLSSALRRSSSLLGAHLSSATAATTPVRWGHTAAEDVKDIETKFDKAMAELKHSFEADMVSLRAEIKKDCQDMNFKHQINVLKFRNDIKAMEARFELLKSQVQEKIHKGYYERLRSFGWFFGAGAALMAKFHDLKKILFG